MKKLSTRSLLFSLISGACALHADAEAPKIVVGIMVDQLRTDYLEQLMPYFGDKGFNRLIRDGVYIPNVDFKNTVHDAPAGTAVVYTGAWPSVNGVAAAELPDPANKHNTATLASDRTKPYSDYSPQNLRLSTLADELYISNGQLSRIYSIAGDPQVAVVIAGHAGNSAIYLDEYRGRWSTPAYYGTLLPAINNKNHASPLSQKISATLWKPLHEAKFYTFGSNWNDGNFTYGFSGNGTDVYNRFKQSAPFNTEATDVAIDLLKNIKAGNAVPTSGMLNVAYSVSPINFDYDHDNRPELVDSYMRLDLELGRLLDAIDKDYGVGNAVIFLSSTGYANEPSIPEIDARIPTGEITLKKAESLLNSYLSASYGNGDYVRFFKNGQLFLDTQVADKKGIDIRKLRSDAKSFLLKMGGINEIFTIDELLRSDNRRSENLVLGIDTKNTPDLLVFFTPGWTVTDDNVYPAVSKKVRISSPATPAIIVAPEYVPETIAYSVNATALAPTIATAINIRAPNGAGDKPLVLKRKHQ